MRCWGQHFSQGQLFVKGEEGAYVLSLSLFYLFQTIHGVKHPIPVSLVDRGRFYCAVILDTIDLFLVSSIFLTLHPQGSHNNSNLEGCSLNADEAARRCLQAQRRIFTAFCGQAPRSDVNRLLTDIKRRPYLQAPSVIRYGSLAP